MAKKDRMNARLKREQKQPYKNPEIMHYIVVTDTTATERNFLEGLRQALPRDIQKKICIKVHNVNTPKMIEKCKEFSAEHPQYCRRWIVFDKDQVPNFDEIIDKAMRCGTSVGWSNPCFEIWLYAYFGKMPTFNSSQQCCKQFGTEYMNQTGQPYVKSEKMLYKKLYDNGDEKTALRIAALRLTQQSNTIKTKPSEMDSTTTVHKLVDEIRSNV